MKFSFINNFIYFLFIFLFFFGCNKNYSHLSIIEENDLNNNLNNMYEEVFLNHSTVLFTLFTCVFSVSNPDRPL